MQILFATSEALPLIKTGGLADVSGALPAALRAIGVDCRLLLPGYPAVLAKLKYTRAVARFDDLPGGVAARLLESVQPGVGVPLYVLDAPDLYDRAGGPYQDATGHDHADNALRFAVLSQVAARLASLGSPLAWHPDILHCNDWQTGLAPAYLRLSGDLRPTVMTVHNLAYQGIFPPHTLPMLDLPAHAFSIAGLEYYGNLSFLKAGLYYADRVTTVSPSYAEEIRSEPLGMGMQGLLAGKGEHLVGILNGIDTDAWNPAADPFLGCAYTAETLEDKAHCKHALQREIGLVEDDAAPLFGMIARMTPQKGMDLVLSIADELVGRGGQLAMLGTGDKDIEAAVRALAQRHPGHVAAHIGYDEGLSHRIEAGADVFLMPSRFEPCGLNQMYSLRYGTVPVVHATGGLRDTVDDGVTGFVFAPAEADALRDAIGRVFDLWRRPAQWQTMMRAGMRQDFSWRRSAAAYAALYQSLLDA
jgi:starch synthase